MSDDAVWDEYRALIRDSIVNRPRSLQVRIGPSELGIDCLKCLARKLAGIPEERGEDWLPHVGTAVHGIIEPVFEPPRFSTELRVEVGTILGMPITGSLDLYDHLRREITDWKIVGTNTLRKVKSRGIAAVPEYRVQVHAYARGCERAGLPVDRVRIAYLPRNEPTLQGTRTVVEAYDEPRVLWALSRAERIAERMLRNGVDATIAELPANEGDCWSCSRYPREDGSYPLAPGHVERKPFAGLLVP